MFAIGGDILRASLGSRPPLEHGCPGKLFVQRTRVFVHRIAIQGGRNLLPPECPPLAYFVKEAGIAAPSSKNATDASPPRSRLQPKNFPRTAVPLEGRAIAYGRHINKSCHSRRAARLRGEGREPRWSKKYGLKERENSCWCCALHTHLGPLPLARTRSAGDDRLVVLRSSASKFICDSPPSRGGWSIRLAVISFLPLRKARLL